MVRVVRYPFPNIANDLAVPSAANGYFPQNGINNL